MANQLETAFPGLLTRAIAWAETKSAEAIRFGVALDPADIGLAEAVGVACPEKIRVQLVDLMPFPDDLALRDAAHQLGLLSSKTRGLTFGYAIFIRHGHRTQQLLSHECRHVNQYEVAGSIGAFLPLYLEQILTHGYAAAPFEIDARYHEQHST